MTLDPATLAEATRVLHDSPLFHGIDKQTLREILAKLHLKCWPRHSHVMEPSDTIRHFYVLLEGRIKVTRRHPETGRELTLFLLGPGNGFNVISLLDGRAHDVDTIALDDVKALSAPVERWHQWLEQYPPLRRALREFVGYRIKQLSELASELALDDTMGRLVHLLLRHFNGDRHTGHPNLIRDLSQEELAHMIGSVRPVVARLLGELKREGIIDTTGGQLHVLDLQRLLEKAEKRMNDANSQSRENPG
ncbi:MAG TPA: Crp/Fnr family transcriptional regulator [Sedimenticola sp.]|nr:Crp/Fnr family transcriptional regulator [Sedimenticola sp.]